MDASRFLKPGEETANLERGVENRWHWGWIEELGEDGKPLGRWCHKLRDSGACFCTACGRKIKYGSSGKKALRKHDKDLGHKASVRALSHTAVLPGASATGDGSGCVGEGTHRTLSMTDRVYEQKIRLCAFIAEHDLVSTYSPAQHLFRTKVTFICAASRAAP